MKIKQFWFALRMKKRDRMENFIHFVLRSLMVLRRIVLNFGSGKPTLFRTRRILDDLIRNGAWEVRRITLEELYRKDALLTPRTA